MTNRKRTAAKLAGIAAAAALILSTVGTASAASQSISYALSTGSMTLGANSYPLPASTGIVGTWDDATGDFAGTFSSEAVSFTQEIVDPVAGTLTLTAQFIASTGVTGNIDPATGTGTLSATFDVVITVQDLTTADDPPANFIVDQICTISSVPVEFTVSASGLGAESEIFTDLSLTASGFSAPAATCVPGPDGNPAFTALVQDGINDAAGLPTSDTSAEFRFTAGAVPPPSTTTTTTTTAAPTTTTTTIAAAPLQPAQAVVASPRFAG